MRQSDHEYEERSFGDIQRAIDFENSMNDLESQLYYRRLSPKEVAQQVLKATCQFYDADWCGLIQVDLDFLIGGYKLSAREFQWSSRTPKQQKKPILRSITCTSGLASGLLLPFPWSLAQSLCLPSGILSGIFSRPVCCGFWPMCCLRRTTNRRC